MKFKENDILYYICPISFFIDKIKISIAVKEKTGIYYIDHTGAYLKEENLFETIGEEKQKAFLELDEFYYSLRMEISKSNPKLNKEI